MLKNNSEPAQALRDDLLNGNECPSDRSHERRGATPTAVVRPECAATSDSRRRRSCERSVAGESDSANSGAFAVFPCSLYACGVTQDMLSLDASRRDPS
jgi:hypothetical protein